MTFGRLAIIPCFTFALQSCEETLPPREDPQDFLGISFSGEPGTVVLEQDLSMISMFPGGFHVGMKNLYDEVLQAEEDISIDITFSVAGNAGSGGVAHGDRNQLFSSWMLQNDLLTVEPDSTALFFIQWDHGGEQLWQTTGLTFHRQPGNPTDETWFKSGSITLKAEGSAKFFKNIPPLELTETTFDIDYTIFIDDPVLVQVDGLSASYDDGAGTVSLTWQTPLEVNNYGFRVEKGTDDDLFPFFDPNFILGAGTTFDTTFYAYTDSLNISSGLWYYRLQRWYNFGFVIWQFESTPSVSALIP